MAQTKLCHVSPMSLQQAANFLWYYILKLSVQTSEFILKFILKRKGGGDLFNLKKREREISCPTKILKRDLQFLATC